MSRTCSNWPACKRNARQGRKLCARCKGKAWRASLKPVGAREQLIEDSGLSFSEGGLGWLDKLDWTELQGLVADLVEQSREFERLADRDQHMIPASWG